MTRYAPRIVLLFILALAAFVRFQGIGFGLPYLEARPDETTIVEHAMGFWSGDFNPHFFAYPTFFMYMVSGLGALKAGIAGSYPASYFSENTPEVYRLARSLSALLGVWTVGLTYLVGRRLFDRRVGLVAALFLALCFLHARDSHFGVTDVPMTAFIMGGMVFVSRMVGRLDGRQGGDGQGRASFLSYAGAAILGGLATSIKYSAAPFCFAILAGHLLGSAGPSVDGGSKQEGGLLKALLSPKLGGAAALMVAAFFAGSPYLLLDFKNFVAEFSGEIRHLGVGHRVVSMRGWFYHPIFSLPFGMGLPLYLGSLLGVGYVVWRYRLRALGLLAFPLAFYLISGKGYTVFVRYMIPLLPFLCITAAVLVCVVAAWLISKFSPRGSTIEAVNRMRFAGIAAALAIPLILPSEMAISGFNRLSGMDDSRFLAEQALDEHSTKNHEALFENDDDDQHWSVAQTGSDWSLLGVNSAYGCDGVVQRFVAPLGFSNLAWDSAAKRFRLNDPLIEEDPRYSAEALDAIGLGIVPHHFVVHRSPLIPYDQVPEEIPAMLERCYERFAVIEGNGPDVEGLPYDQQDAFYLPLRGFDRVVRPGPDIELWARKPGVTAEDCLPR
ncbi:hypothetical protein ABI59_07105 [Acidobacteria bacterium Mor1]|nr:hypothetical protein ABI59_07105 [Acidobacteria bacterium Mor1]